jgi:energy-coupling factor transport system permease protein
MRFMNHMTFGQYIPVDSFIHRLDPRGKILSTTLLLTGIFLMGHFPVFILWGGALLILAAMSRLPVRLVLAGARPVLILVLFTGILHLFFTGGTPVASFGPLEITREGIRLAAMMSTRLVFLVLFASFLTLTTSPMELADGIERLFSPFVRFGFPAHELAMMMTISLRFIPTLLDETDRIMKAQVARGAKFDQGSFFCRMKSFLPVLVPLFVIVFQRADDLAVAMESRCYTGGGGRSRMNPLAWKGNDSFALFCVAAFILLAEFADRYLSWPGMPLS